MNSTARLETVTGFLVIALAVLFLGYGMRNTDISQAGHYSLTASFADISGVSNGTDVKMAGVKIGTVSDTSLDSNNYQAKITLSIKEDVKIPKDSAVKISSDGLLGGSHIVIDAGSDEALFKDGEAVLYTQGAVSLMDLLGRAVFGATSSPESKTESQ